MRRALLGLLVTWLVATLASAQAGAQEAAPAAAGASYEAALAESLAAHARGDYAAAQLFMERAHALEPSARTLRGLGIVAFARGAHADAIRHLDAAMASETRPLPPELRASVEELLAHAWAQVGRYELAVDAEHATFVVDGAPPNFYAPRTVILAAGEHRLLVQAQGRVPHELRLQVRPGEQRSLFVVLSRQAAEDVPPPLTPPPTPSEPHTGWTPARRWALVGAGSALVASSAVVWGLAIARLHRIAEDCREQEDAACSEREAEGAYRGENIEGLGISAVVLLSAGAATFLTVGALELWHTSARSKRAEVSLRAGLGSLTLESRF
jgi:tetratricopeptide (TPR) repeat protein